MTLNEYLKNRAGPGQRPSQAPDLQYKVIGAFAEQIGVSITTVYRYLSGERFPHPDVMRRIIAATDGTVGPIDFLDSEGSVLSQDWTADSAELA